MGVCWRRCRGPACLRVVAVTVGGTFIVVTLAAMRAARELTAGATRLVAAITTAFATGQLVGPLLARSENLTPRIDESQGHNERSCGAGLWTAAARLAGREGTDQAP